MVAPVSLPPSNTPGDFAGDPVLFDQQKMAWYLWFQAACPQFNALASGLQSEILAAAEVAAAASATAAANEVLTSKVTGPASATANAFAKFDGVTGKIVKVSGVVEDASGNVGVGAVPGTWFANRRVLQIGGNTVSNLNFGAAKGENTYNTFYTAAGVSQYQVDGPAAIIDFNYTNAGGFAWKIAPSGTAGNPITFTQAMTLDAFGRLTLALGAIDSGSGAGYMQLNNHKTGDLEFVNRVSGNGINFYVGATSLAGKFDSGGNLTPGGDNTQTNGSGAKRWSVIYAGTGTINTSDAREKTDVRVMAADEIEAAKALSKEIGVYQFLASVDAKGDKARHHIGMTVQRAIEIMRHYGLDPFSYGFICYDKWDEQVTEHPAIEARAAVEAKAAVLDDEGNVVEPAVEAQPAIEAKDAWTEVTLKAGDRYSFRYDQLTLFIARGIDARLAALEAA